jgi:hypothetical protein
VLPAKQMNSKAHEQIKKFVTLVHSELIAITNIENRAYLVSWLFLIGSLIFMADGILELTEDISIHAIFHNLASLLFTIGSIFFLLDTRQN